MSCARISMDSRTGRRFRSVLAWGNWSDSQRLMEP